VEALPPDRQDIAGELLLWVAEQNERKYTLTPEQLADLDASIAETERGEFATEEEMAEVWKKFGL
jgi:predicted transcriptional regulator